MNECLIVPRDCKTNVADKPEMKVHGKPNGISVVNSWLYTKNGWLNNIEPTLKTKLLTKLTQKFVL